MQGYILSKNRGKINYFSLFLLNCIPFRKKQEIQGYFAEVMIPEPITKSPSYSTTACPGVMAR